MFNQSLINDTKYNLMVNTFYVLENSIKTLKPYVNYFSNTLNDYEKTLVKKRLEQNIKHVQQHKSLRIPNTINFINTTTNLDSLEISKLEAQRAFEICVDNGDDDLALEFIKNYNIDCEQNFGSTNCPIFIWILASRMFKTFDYIIDNYKINLNAKTPKGTDVFELSQLFGNHKLHNKLLSISS